MTISAESVAKAIALIKKGPANADYFFEQLKSPDWIAPLDEEQLFSRPYAADQHDDTVSFPFWAPGQYLARMAKLPAAQRQVVAIFKRLPESDNPRVYECIATAAASLPPRLSKELLPQLLAGLNLPYQLILPEIVGDVIVVLSRAKDSGDAFRLAEKLFELVPAQDSSEIAEDDSKSRRVIPDVRARFDSWHYAKLLEKCMPELADIAGVQTVALLCDLLEVAVRHELGSSHEAPKDHSYIWRSEIAHSDSYREKIKDDLVTAVRDIADRVCVNTPREFGAIVQLLMDRPYRIFHRIALYLIDLRGDAALEAVRSIFRNPEDWRDVGYHPEYERALAHHWNQLDPEKQQQFLDWIDRGPNLEGYGTFRAQMDGRAPSDEEVERHRDTWARDHLGVIAKDLRPPYRERLAELVKKYGPAREPGPLFRISVSSRGETSPLSSEDTLSIDWPTLIAKAREWSPSSADFDGPSLEGFASSIRQRVGANPPEAIHFLDQATDLNPLYVSAILEALRETLKKKEPLAWEPLLEFIVRELNTAQAAPDSNGRWRWVSKCAASLLEDAFDAGAASIPISLRPVVWSVLSILAENPDPTPEHEERYGGTNMDPATLSLNTVRGETFHAIMRYSLWWRQHLESMVDTVPRLESGWGELPEVRAVLEAHLDSTLDPSLAVRAVYGQWFPWLVLLDSKWASTHVRVIFPSGRDEERFFWAAWGTYVVFTQPFSNVLPVLRDVYAQAIMALNDGTPSEVGMGARPAEHLTDHLMTYYLRGDLSLGDDGMITSFFRQANGPLRGHAFEWIGRALGTFDNAVPEAIIVRSKALWDWRVSGGAVAKEELESFGWWFGSGVLDQAWSMNVLREILDTQVLPEPDHLVVERLAIIADSDIDGVLECVDRMINLASKGWEVHSWIDSLRKILRAGLSSSRGPTRDRARLITNRLGAMRFRDFRDLLRDVVDS